MYINVCSVTLCDVVYICYYLLDHVYIPPVWDRDYNSPTARECKVVQTHETSTRAHTRSYCILTGTIWRLCIIIYVIVSCIPPVGLGRIEYAHCPSVEWFDPVQLGTHPQWDGGGEFTHCSRVKGGTTPPTRHAHSFSHSLHSPALYSL